MTRTGFWKVACILTLFSAAQYMAASVTYIVGTCKKGTSFPTISAALAATPPPNTVEVCPGTYPEQVVITQAVTLQGINSGNSAEAVIVPPSSGLVANAMDDYGNPIAAQVWADQPSGSVNLSALAIDGSGNGVSTFPPFIIGILVGKATVTMSHVTTRNQKGNGGGVGILALDGASAGSTVTVKNSSIHDFDGVGIWGQENLGGGLTTDITGNFVNASSVANNVAAITPGAIVIEGGMNATVSNNNLVGGGGSGGGGLSGVGGSLLLGGGATGTLTGNTILVGGGGSGIQAGSASDVISSNKIWGGGNSGTTGVSLTANATVQSNTIAGNYIGVELNGNSDVNVKSNTIIDGMTGVDQVPSGLTLSNTYYDMGTTFVGSTGGDNFTMSGSPDTLDFAPGGSGTSTISTAVTAGGTQNVNLSISGLPSGASAVYEPTAIIVGESSTLKVSAASTTAVGTYKLTVTGTGTSATQTISLTLTICALTGC